MMMIDLRGYNSLTVGHRYLTAVKPNFKESANYFHHKLLQYIINQIWHFYVLLLAHSCTIYASYANWFN